MLVDKIANNVRRRKRSAFAWPATEPQGGSASNTQAPQAPPSLTSLPAATLLTEEPVADFDRILLDSITSEKAVIDSSGRIAAASKGWRSRSSQFELERDPDAARAPLDFLADDRKTARAISRAVTAILSGRSDGQSISFSATRDGQRRRFCLHLDPIWIGSSHGVAAFNDDVSDIFTLQGAMNAMARKLVHSEDNERRRIAREMHDSTLQDLVAIGLELRQLQQFVRDEAARDILAEVRSILSHTQRDVRTMSYLLHPPLLEEGGLPLALSALVRGLSSRTDLNIDFICDCCDAGTRLPADVEVALYRVTQEALINVHKHASATSARVRCGRDGDHLVLTVEDNGTGLGGSNGCHIGSGVGIDGMRARLAQFGGRLVLSNLRRGTRLRAIVPIDWAAV